LSLVGPKVRPQGVADGCQVEIPEPGVGVEYVGTLLRGKSRCWFTALWATTRVEPSGEMKLANKLLQVCRGKYKVVREELLFRLPSNSGWLKSHAAKPPGDD
jgi:hypothetical protein